MRALRPYRVELTRDYHVSWDELDRWALDDLLALASDVASRCVGNTAQYRRKRW